MSDSCAHLDWWLARIAARQHGVVSVGQMRRIGLDKHGVYTRARAGRLDQRVAVETGTYAFHRGTIAFEDDHARDLDLRRRGYDVRRFTYRQVRNEPVRIAVDLRDALGLSS